MDYAEEVDAEIEQNRAEAEAAYQAWQAERRLLA